ncbi:MAG: ABC transporter permease [Candidatus Marinimicrobia bacterium]|jgi:sodium transport system permease protein|nr:ABC transporter permease [Candidatus Neomarinimicrobiota bacterium]MBT3946539.1 ABC transporter permease [Candidatus Neomarinimicrobiota bacterium]MBT4064035.1 ABC transporter permease [Candidatus Neomarinimicrobiota bacterium]MBT4308162.1 ABC transporter permease [Candidatus Neomarinimicrobiota bacterium]MBT4454045.1 ABC transporter permease [Candidatus Neomarinimicrobiota bacterium]
MKFLTIAKKEVIDIFRDRRTIIMMVVVPLFLIPVLLGTVFKITKSMAEKASEKQLKVQIYGQEYAPDLYQAFADMNKVIILDQIPTDSIQSYIQQEFLDVAIHVDSDYKVNIAKNGQAKIRIQFKGTDSFGITKDRINGVLKKFENQIVSERMDRLNLKPEVVRAYNINYEDVASKQEKFGKIAGGWFPYVFIIFGFMGAMYPALDLGAGEKERGTLETILSSPASRLDIVLGKFLVVLLAAFLTAFLALGGMAVGIQRIPDIPPEVLIVINEVLNPKTIGLIMTLVLPVAAFFSAMLLGLSIYAKSFKEAQSIVAPLNIVIIFPAVIGTLPGMELNAITSLIPVLNVSLASKDIIAGVINPLYMAEVYMSLFGFAGLAIFWCVKMFNWEKTIFRS